MPTQASFYYNYVNQKAGGITVLYKLLRQFKARQTARRVLLERRRGTGLHTTEWHLVPEDSPVEGQRLLDVVVTWCRQTVGSSRRPWGIDRFDLALAYRHSGEQAVRSLRLPKLSPKDLYADTIANQLARFLHSHVSESRGGIHIAAAIFSWGDAAHAALPASS